MISEGYKANYATLKRAFAAGDVALMEVQEVATGSERVVLCVVNRTDDEVEFVPVAVMVWDDPYTLFNPPRVEGGFYSQEEVHDG